MNNLVSKKDQQGQCCIIHGIRHGIATEIHCFTESTWEVVLKAADIRGDKFSCLGVILCSHVKHSNLLHCIWLVLMSIRSV